MTNTGHATILSLVLSGLMLCAATAGTQEAGTSAGEVSEEELRPYMEMSALELARSYERIRNMDWVLFQADLGWTVVTERGTITRDNVDEVRSEVEVKAALCREAVRRRGSKTIQGSYIIRLSPECSRARASWTNYLAAQKEKEAHISQDGCEAVLTHGPLAAEKDNPVQLGLLIVESSLAFQDPMDSSFVFVGEVLDGQINIRPDVEAVLSASPAWAMGRPKRRDLQRCEVTLVRKAQGDAID